LETDKRKAQATEEKTVAAEEVDDSKTRADDSKKRHSKQLSSKQHSSSSSESGAFLIGQSDIQNNTAIGQLDIGNGRTIIVDAMKAF
jgi:hypothetical protein